MVENHDDRPADRSIGLDESARVAVAGRRTGQQSVVIRLVSSGKLTDVSSDTDDRGYEYPARTDQIVGRLAATLGSNPRT